MPPIQTNANISDTVDNNNDSSLSEPVVSCPQTTMCFFQMTKVIVQLKAINQDHELS